MCTVHLELECRELLCTVCVSIPEAVSGIQVTFNSKVYCMYVIVNNINSQIYNKRTLQLYFHVGEAVFEAMVFAWVSINFFQYQAIRCAYDDVCVK